MGKILKLNRPQVVDDFDDKIISATKVGKLIAYKQMFKAVKAGLLAYGSFMLAKRLTNDSRIGFVVGGVAAITEFVNFQSLAEMKKIFANDNLNQYNNTEQQSDNEEPQNGYDESGFL